MNAKLTPEQIKKLKSKRDKQIKTGKIVKK